MVCQTAELNKHRSANAINSVSGVSARPGELINGIELTSQSSPGMRWVCILTRHKGMSKIDKEDTDNVTHGIRCERQTRT
jgi:hypothetical protein